MSDSFWLLRQPVHRLAPLPRSRPLRITARYPPVLIRHLDEAEHACRTRLEGRLMTCTPAPSPVPGDHQDRCHHRVWQELTACGLNIDEPTPSASMCFSRNLSGGQIEIDLLATGEFHWEYLPHGEISPRQVAAITLTLLTRDPARLGPSPAPGPGQPLLPEAAAHLLAARAMRTHLEQIRYDDGSGQEHTEAVITSPAHPARGVVRISGEPSIRWQCHFPGPVGGLTPRTIVQAITTALAQAPGP